MSKLTYFLIIIFTCFTANVSADNLPRGCEIIGFGFYGYNLVLNDRGGQSFYLLQNKSEKEIILQRVIEQDEMIRSKYISKLDSLNWAAFATNTNSFEFNCFQVDDNITQKIDCREYLQICKYPRAKFAMSNMGNYWVSTNKTQQQIIADAIAKGIYLRW